jgi:hypothetical protein
MQPVLIARVLRVRDKLEHGVLSKREVVPSLAGLDNTLELPLHKRDTGSKGISGRSRPGSMRLYHDHPEPFAAGHLEVHTALRGNHQQMGCSCHAHCWQLDINPGPEPVFSTLGILFPR